MPNTYVLVYPPVVDPATNRAQLRQDQLIVAGAEFVLNPAVFVGVFVRIIGDTMTGQLVLRAGAAGAGTAPLLLQSGALNTVPVAGALEFLTDKAYLVVTTGAARKELALVDPAAGLTLGRVPFGTTNGRLLDDAELFWDNATKRLLIGPTSPATTMLDVTSAATAVVRLRGDSQTTAAGQEYGDIFSGGGEFGFFGYGTQDFRIATNGTRRLTVLTGGNIGFGTTAPLYLCHNVSPFAKTDTTQRQLWFMSSNEAAAGFPQGLLFSIVGAAAIGNRVIDISTTEYNVAWGGALVLQKNAGNVGIGIGTTVPVARLHLPAGTATAGTAPLKFTSGALLATAVAGVVEFLTDAFYGTITTGAARKIFLMADPAAGLTSGRLPFVTTNGRLTDAAGATLDGTTLTAPVLATTTSLNVGASGTPITQMRVYTPNLTPANVAAGTSAEETFAVVGLSTGDTVVVDPPSSVAGCGLVGARVSAADTLALTFGNFQTIGAVSPPAGVYRVLAVRS